MIEVTICPIPLIRAPSHIPKYNAAKKPGLESKATDCIGLGRWIKDPTTVSVVNIDSLAIL